MSPEDRQVLRGLTEAIESLTQALSAVSVDASDVEQDDMIPIDCPHPPELRTFTAEGAIGSVYCTGCGTRLPSASGMR